MTDVHQIELEAKKSPADPEAAVDEPVHDECMNVKDYMETMMEHCQGNPRYKAIHRLHEKLTELHVQHCFRDLYDGWQVLYPSSGYRLISVVEHRFSYGAKDDLMEMMEWITCDAGEVYGWKTVDEILKTILEVDREIAKKRDGNLGGMPV